MQNISHRWLEKYIRNFILRFYFIRYLKLVYLFAKLKRVHNTFMCIVYSTFNIPLFWAILFLPHQTKTKQSENGGKKSRAFNLAQFSFFLIYSTVKCEKHPHFFLLYFFPHNIHTVSQNISVSVNFHKTLFQLHACFLLTYIIKMK